jgi:hypothetical protein
MANREYWSGFRAIQSDYMILSRLYFSSEKWNHEQKWKQGIIPDPNTTWILLQPSFQTLWLWLFIIFPCSFTNSVSKFPQKVRKKSSSLILHCCEENTFVPIYRKNCKMTGKAHLLVFVLVLGCLLCFAAKNDVGEKSSVHFLNRRCRWRSALRAECLKKKKLHTVTSILVLRWLHDVKI